MPDLHQSWPLGRDMLYSDLGTDGPDSLSIHLMSATWSLSNHLKHQKEWGNQEFRTGQGLSSWR